MLASWPSGPEAGFMSGASGRVRLRHRQALDRGAAEVQVCDGVIPHCRGGSHCFRPGGVRKEGLFCVLGGFGHSSFSLWLPSETTWHHPDFFFISLSWGSAKSYEAVKRLLKKNPHREPWTPSLSLPPCVVTHFKSLLLSFYGVMMMRMRSFGGQSGWGTPWLENLTAGHTVAEAEVKWFG